MKDIFREKKYQHDHFRKSWGWDLSLFPIVSQGNLSIAEEIIKTCCEMGFSVTKYTRPRSWTIKHQKKTTSLRRKSFFFRQRRVRLLHYCFFCICKVASDSFSLEIKIMHFLETRSRFLCRVCSNLSWTIWKPPS